MPTLESLCDLMAALNECHGDIVAQAGAETALFGDAWGGASQDISDSLAGIAELAAEIEAHPDHVPYVAPPAPPADPDDDGMPF